MNHDDLPGYWQSRPRAGWALDAACVGKPTRWWFDERLTLSDQAREVCAVCPVSDDCLAFAIRSEPHGEQYRHGIFGGLNGPERERFAAHRVIAA